MRGTAVPQTEDDAVSVSSETDRRPSSARRGVTHHVVGASGRRLIMDPEREGVAAYSFAHDDDSYEASENNDDPVRMAIADAKRRQQRRRRGLLLFLLVSGVTMIVLGITLGLLYGPNHEQRTGPESALSSSNPYDTQGEGSNGELSNVPPPEKGSSNTGHLYVVPEPSMDLALICNPEMFSEDDVNAVQACRTECEPGLCCWLKDPLGSCYDWGETNSITCSQYYEPCILLDEAGESTMTAETDGTETIESEKDVDRPIDEGFIDPSDLVSNPPIIDDDIWRDGRQDAKWTLLLYENFETPSESVFQPGYVLNGDKTPPDAPDADFFVEDPSTLSTPEDSFTHSGVTSVMIRDHEEVLSSVTSTVDLDLTPYGQVKIKFWFKGGGGGDKMTGMEGYYENGGYADSFLLEYSSDGGVTWDGLKEYEAATDDYPYNGGYGGLETQYTMSRLASEPFDFTNQARFRFRADANGDNDQVFIDDIEISGGPPEEGVVGLDPMEVQDVWTPKLDNEKWTVLTYDHFEYGFDDDRCNFVTGGKDSYIYSITPQEGRSLYVNSGSQSVLLRDDNDKGNSCIYHKNNLDVTPFAQLRVRFWFVGDETDKFEEDNSFSLDYSSDGGDNWLMIKEYWFGSPDFPVAATPQEMVVVLDRTHTDIDFTTNAKFRFSSHGNSNGDVIYIDDVEVCGGGDGTGFPVVEQVSGLDGDENRPDVVPEMIFWDNTPDDPEQPPIDLDGGQWTTLMYDDFETSDDLDSSHWQRDDGDAVRMSTEGPPKSNSGYNAVRLSDKTDYDDEGNIEDEDPTLAYIYTKSPIDVTPYSQIRILFWFSGSEEQGFEDEEFFILEYSKDGGDTWNEVKRWVRGSDDFYKNGVGYLGYAYMDASDGETNTAVQFTKDAILRFHSFAGGSSDRVYIDDILVSGNTGEPVIGVTGPPEDLEAKAPFPIWSEEEVVETTVGEGWEILIYDDFEGENGFDDSFFDGSGEHVRLYDDGRPNCNSGTHSVRLQEDADESSSLTLREDFDASSYQELRVRFWYRGRGDNNLGFDDDDSFGLEVSSDSAQTWTLAKEWAYGSDDFEENGVDYLASQLISSDPNVNGGIVFTSTMRLRFRAMSKDKNAKVFLDDIELVGR